MAGVVGWTPNDPLGPDWVARKWSRVRINRPIILRFGFISTYDNGMKNDVSEVGVKGVMPTANGCAIFLGNTEKTFVIYVDHTIGAAISMTINSVKKERPLTHDLIGSIFTGLGVEVSRVVINDVHDGTYFARLLLTMKNELGTKLIEIDSRPSDCIVLALQKKKPILVARQVMDSVEDMSEVLEKILKQQSEAADEDESL